MPVQRTGEQESTVGPPRTGGSVRPVPFDRLLSLAVLTPAQATLIAVQLLDAADVSGTKDLACLGAVSLTPSGVVDVVRLHADEGTRLTELLKQLLHNTRRLPAHPRQEQLLLLHKLEETTRDPLLEPGARARELEGVLADTLGSGARQRLSRQLAALVDAFARVTPSVPGPTDPAVPRLVGPATAAAAVPGAASVAADSSRSAPSQAAPARPASGRPPRRSRARLHPRKRGRRVALVVLVLVLAAVLAGSGYFVLRGPGATNLPFGLGNQPTAPGPSAPAHPSKKSANHPKPHHRPAVSTLAPRHAGAVTGVVVQKVGSCKPGALCPVKVTVHFRAASTSRPVGWKVGVARLCKRGITWSAPTTVTAQSGWTRVFAHSSVRVPKGRSLALVALTTTPARAQSRPLPVTGSSLRC